MTPAPAPAPAVPALPSGWSLASADRICDLHDRVITIDAAGVTVITRPTLARTTAPISNTEHLPDRCTDDNGNETAHAGCSITYRRFWSPVLGASHLELGNNAGNVLDSDDGTSSESCREWDPYQVIATCSTADHFVLIKHADTLTASLWTGASDQPAQTGASVDRAAPPGTWVLRFGAHALVFDRASSSATLDGTPCIAFRLGETSF